MDTTSEEPRPLEGGRSRVRSWLTGGLVALVLYVLSIGPVYRLERLDIIPDGEIFMIYQPLEILSDHSATVDRFLNWYVCLWVPPLRCGTIPIPRPIEPVSE